MSGQNIGIEFYSKSYIKLICLNLRLVFATFVKKTMLTAVSLYMIFAGVGLIFSNTLIIYQFSQAVKKNDTSLYPVKWRRNLNFIGGYLIAILLFAGSASLYLNWRWNHLISLLSLVALVYYSLKNYSWNSGDKNSLGYGPVMTFGFIGGAVCIIILTKLFK